MGKKIEEIIVDAKKKGDAVSKIIEEATAEEAEEYKKARLRRLISEEEARQREADRKGRPLDPRQSMSFSGRILEMAQVDPAKAKAFLEGLGPEEMNKLATLMAMENDRAGAILKLAQSSGTSVKDMVEIMKIMRPTNGGMDLKGIAEIFNAGVNAAKAQGQPANQLTLEGVLDKYVNPFIDKLSEKDKQTFDARLESLRKEIPPPLGQQIEHTRQLASQLGLTEGKSRPEYDLKLEEMRQSHDLDMKRLDWTQRKYFLESEKERDKWDAIRQTFAPIFQMNAPAIQDTIRDLGKGVAQQFQGPKQPNPQVTGQPQQGIKTQLFTCKNCGQQMTIPDPVPPGIGIGCPNCGHTHEPSASQAPQGEEAPPVRTLRPKYR